MARMVEMKPMICGECGATLRYRSSSPDAPGLREAMRRALDAPLTTGPNERPALEWIIENTSEAHIAQFASAALADLPPRETLDVERLRHALHSADVIHPTSGDGGYCHCRDRAAFIAASYAAQSKEPTDDRPA